MRFYLARTALVAIAVSFIGSSFSFADPLEDAIKDLDERRRKLVEVQRRRGGVGRGEGMRGK